MHPQIEELVDRIVRGEIREGYVFDRDLQIERRPDLVRLPRGFTVPSLTIDDCPSLEALPDGLTVKHGVTVRGCPALRRIGRGVYAGSLDVAGCAALQEIPDDLRCESLTLGPGVRALREGLEIPYLYLGQATSLRALPARTRAKRVFLPASVEELGEGSVVEVLCVGEGSPIRAVPAGVHVTEELLVRGAPRLSTLPPRLDLAKLDLSRSGIRALVGEIHARATVDLTGCASLERIEGPIRAETLRLDGCARLEHLADASVVNLHAGGCSSLRHLPAGVRATGVVDLCGCTALAAIDLEEPPSGLLLLDGPAQIALLRPSLRGRAVVPVQGRGAPLGDPQVLPAASARVSITPDGSRIATASNEEIAVWDASGERVATARPRRGTNCVAIAPDGEQAAVGAGFHHHRPADDLWLLDVRGGGLVSIGALGSKPLLEVNQVGFSRDGRLVAGMERSGRALVVDASTRALVEERPSPSDRSDRRWPLDAPPASRHAPPLEHRLADGRHLALTGGRLVLSDPSSSRPTVLAVIDGPFYGASGALLVDEARGEIVACTNEGAIRVLALPSLSPIAEGRSLPRVSEITRSADGSTIAVATEEAVCVYRATR